MTTATKPRPFLARAREVRGLLDGSITQIRRAIKPQPESPCVMAPDYAWIQGKATCIWPAPYTLEDGSRPDHHVTCPFGSPGDLLAVKEAFARRLDVDPEADPEKAKWYALYEADGISLNEPHWHSYPNRWTPPSRMPAWASRLTLEVVEVRVQRLGEISQDDAMASGIRPVKQSAGQSVYTWYGTGDVLGPNPLQAHANLWEHDNGKGSWSPDLWTWVATVKRWEGMR